MSETVLCCVFADPLSLPFPRSHPLPLSSSLYARTVWTTALILLHTMAILVISAGADELLTRCTINPLSYSPPLPAIINDARRGRSGEMLFYEPGLGTRCSEKIDMMIKIYDPDYEGSLK